MKKILFYWCFGSTVYYEGKLRQYCIFLSETYTTLDCIVIDNATLSDHNDIWPVAQSGLIFERKEEYTEFSITTATNKYVPLNQTFSDCIIEMDICVTSDGAFCDIINSNGERVARSGGINTIGTINNWIPIKIIFNNGTITLTNTNISVSSVLATNVEYTSFRWLNFANTSQKVWFKNFKLYPI